MLLNYNVKICPFTDVIHYSIEPVELIMPVCNRDNVSDNYNQYLLGVF